MNAPAATRATSLDALRSPQEASMPAVAPGFGSLQSFELMQRQAKLLCSSTLVPAQYRAVVVKTDYKGNEISRTENPNALSNCVIALNMASRMNADPLMVMQNLYLVEGRPSWSSQWIIAQINNCGRFSPLRFSIQDLGEKTVEYTTYQWNDATRRKEAQTQKVKIHDKQCIAWVIEKGTEEKLFSPPVSIGMAVAEGWYTKNGSKWQTMDEVMLRYRAAAFFGKLYAPELLMGLPSAEESADVIDMELQAGGGYAMADSSPVTLDAMREAAAPAPALTEQKPVTVPPPQTKTETPAYVDRETGEIRESAATQQQDDGAPGFADAHAAVRAGDFDLARDIARSLPEQQRQQIEAAIANLSQAREESESPAPQAQPARRGRGQGGLSLE
ncbi:hypothetical protein B447_10673 [Thauera sp. 27]|uniref:hypothetical protein n=1 Tax=Thauera sp. 27 TaxID=305700 RepID=UPI0002D0D90E|nr:hypothetical protein [Thauera sp. 27]ENO80924.1 hypothetical protein B447_10673 [Thauera sp. 27]